MGRCVVIKYKSGERTLFASVLLSSPGPLAVGLGLFLGRSSTQLADFIRRTVELSAIIISWAIFRITHKDGEEDAAKKAKLESIASYCVGSAMCLSGAVMLLITLSYSGEKGNVIPGLVIAVLGFIVNTWFWLRYTKLNKANPNTVLEVQSRLYRAKSIVDVCVTLALFTIMVSPGSMAALYMDAAGSAAVSVYLIITGVATFRVRA